MPYIAPRPYHDFPFLHAVLDFLERAELDGQQMVVRYPDLLDLHTAHTACLSLGIQPLVQHSAPGKSDPRHYLCISSIDWRALSKNVLPMLAGQLRLLTQAVDDVTALAPLQWDALPLADRTLAAWGKAAGMIALHLKAAQAYLECRYPPNAPQRQKLMPISDAAQASRCKTHHALGFLIAAEGGMHYLACHGDDWRNELALSTDLLRHHLTLLMRIGLQLAGCGDNEALPDLCRAFARVGRTLTERNLQAALQAYLDHVAASAPGSDPAATAALFEHCLASFQQWRQEGRLPAGDAPLAAPLPFPLRQDAQAPSPMIGRPPEQGALSAGHRTSSTFAGPTAFAQPSRGLSASSGLSAPKRKRDPEDVSGGDMKRFRRGAAGPDGPAMENEPAGMHQIALPRMVPVHVVFLADWAVGQYPRIGASRRAVSATSHATESAGTAPGAADAPLLPPPRRVLADRGWRDPPSANRPPASRPFAAFRLSVPDGHDGRNQQRRAGRGPAGPVAHADGLSRRLGEAVRARQAPVQDIMHDAAPATLQPFPMALFHDRGPWF